MIGLMFRLVRVKPSSNHMGWSAYPCWIPSQHGELSVVGTTRSLIWEKGAQLAGGDAHAATCCHVAWFLPVFETSQMKFVSRNLVILLVFQNFVLSKHVP